MNISHRIAGPVAVLGLIALTVVGWLVWSAPEVGTSADGAGRRGATAAARLAGVREAQRLSAGLAAAVLEPGGATPAVHRMFDQTVAVALSDLASMRALAAGYGYQPEIDRLIRELTQWHEAVEQVSHAAATGAGASAPGVAAGSDWWPLRPPATREALASRLEDVIRLTDEVAERVARSRAEAASERRAARLRQGTLAFGVLLSAVLGLCWLALRFAGRLARDMDRLPRDLLALAGDSGSARAVVPGRQDLPDGAALPDGGALATGAAPASRIAGEARSDEFGDMVRDLRAFARTMQGLTRSRAEMQRMALTDPLTGLPNRRGLYDFLAKVGLRRGWSDGPNVAVMHIDLDHFKPINDAHGHEARDHVLREATRRMALAIRDSDILARVGGDEFVIVAIGVSSAASLQRLADRVIRQFDEPVLFRDTTLHVTASIGAVLGGRRGGIADPKRLLFNADIALAHAKSRGRNRCSMFTSEMARNARRLQEQASEIRRGIDRGEFRMSFRPVIDARTGERRALDVVPRWQHPERGILMPRDFLEAAEAHNLTGAMLMPALEASFRQVADWRASGHRVPVLHLWMSRSMLLAPQVVDRLRWMLDDNGLEPWQVAIQIGESHCAGRGAEAIFENLHRLSGLGAGLVIDDFGSVDAALGNVIRLGADAIKIDVGLEGGLGGGLDGGRFEGRERSDAAAARLQGLLPAIVGIGDSLGFQVLAKGVADRGAVEGLLAHGFGPMQGDAIAPPMEASDTVTWFAGASPGRIRLASG